MEIKVIDLAHKHGLNPDQLTSFATNTPEKYGLTDFAGGVDTAKVSSKLAPILVYEFKLSNSNGHDWREVKESLFEDETGAQVPVTDPVVAQKLANGQTALAREDMKLQALKDKMIPINKKKAQIQKAMIRAQEENARNMKAQATEQAKQQSQIKVAQEAQAAAQQTSSASAVAAQATVPTTESLLQNDLDQIELLEDQIVVLMQKEKPDYTKINNLIEGLKINKLKLKPEITLESDNPMSRDKFYDLSEAFDDLEKKTEIEDDYIFYVKVYNDDDWFIGKIFKNDPIEDWYGLVKAGEDDVFEKISYDPEYDKNAIVDFLKKTYDQVELIDNAEYNDYAEEAPNDIDEEGGVTGMHL